MKPTWRRPAFGHGRGWLHDYRGDVLLTVDPHTLRAGIHCAGLRGDPDLNKPGAQILITTDAVWAASGNQLIQVDPGSAAWHEVPVPVTGGRRRRWAATPDGLVGTDWPTGRVTWVRADQPVTTREFGGHLASIAAGGSQVWIVDRTDETLLGLDVSDLHITCRVPLHRGDVEFLIPLVSVPPGDDVLVSHTGELRHGGRYGVWRVTPNGQRTLVLDCSRSVDTGTGHHRRTFVSYGGKVLGARAPTVAATDGTTLWIGEGWDPGDMQIDPVGILTPIDLATGLPGEPLRVAGQVDDLAWAFGRLWLSGFVRSRQETVLTVIDPTTRRLAEVDFTDVDIRPYLPPREERPAPDYDAELDRLIGELRTSLTGTSLIHDDERTGQTRPGGPRVHEQFRLLDLALDRATPAVRITFEWASEPDVRFAYDWPISIPPITSVAGDVSVFFTEEICTGLVWRAEREHRDGFVVLRLPR